MRALYQCGVCDCFHPWEWDEDYQDDENRFAVPEDYADRFNIPIADITVRSWEDRCTSPDVRSDAETRALLNAHPQAMALIERMRGQLARMEGKIRELEVLLPSPDAKEGQ